MTRSTQQRRAHRYGTRGHSTRTDTRARITRQIAGIAASAVALTVGIIGLWSSIQQMNSDLWSASPIETAEPIEPTKTVAQSASAGSPKDRRAEQKPMELDVDNDYYRILGPAEKTYSINSDKIGYCPLDERGRTTCAFGELTSALRAQARAANRQEITVNPSGWPTQPNGNTKVTIPALSGSGPGPGSQDYHGWFWNRSHLLADSLGGSAVVENLVTGTRTQNVGSTKQRGQHAGGMAYTELLARNYLDSGAGNNCPLYYAATPQYTGDERIPRTVLVDVQSCDKSINMRVEVLNAANGYAIDYVTGTYHRTGLR